MIPILECTETKERSIIMQFINELNSCINAYNDARSNYEIPENLIAAEKEFEQYFAEHFFIIRDRCSVFKEDYIYNLISDDLKKTLNDQLDNIRNSIDQEKKELHDMLKN